jgi:outer membrane protein assembly factor BamB
MTFKHYAALLLMTAGLAGCGGNWFGEPEKPPLEGERISVLDYERDLRPDENAKISAFEMPAAQQNVSWPQAGGQPHHAMGNLALAGNLERAWSADIGDGSRSKLPLTAQPIVLGKSIFTLDTSANLSSFATDDGKRRWSINVRDNDEKDSVISGGIAAEGDTIYVAAGYDEVVAVDAVKGEIKWRAPLNSPSRAAPSVSNGRVFVTTLNNTLYAFDTTNGEVLWEFAGMGRSTGLVGAASPALSGEFVVPAFSSGEIYALRANNGSIAWSDNLSNTLRLGGLTALSDIRGLPVIENNTAYAVSFGGKMAAIDMTTGARVWQRDIASAKTPWVVGNRVFLISTNGQIVSLDKKTGSVVWVSQLARFKDTADKTGAIFWTGPILAGDRLFAFSSDGRVAEVHPEQGTLIREWSSRSDVRISPVIAGGTLYILGEDGTLSAYR